MYTNIPNLMNFVVCMFRSDREWNTSHSSQGPDFLGFDCRFRSHSVRLTRTPRYSCGSSYKVVDSLEVSEGERTVYRRR